MGAHIAPPRSERSSFAATGGPSANSSPQNLQGRPFRALDSELPADPRQSTQHIGCTAFSLYMRYKHTQSPVSYGPPTYSTNRMTSLGKGLLAAVLLPLTLARITSITVPSPIQLQSEFDVIVHTESTSETYQDMAIAWGVRPATEACNGCIGQNIWVTTLFGFAVGLVIMVEKRIPLQREAGQSTAVCWTSYLLSQGSYPHTPFSPTLSSLSVWEEASEALLNDDSRIGYETKGLEEFVGGLRGGRGVRGWLRGWVEGRSLDELMRRSDVTAPFILVSSIAILASEQEKASSSGLLPPHTTHLVGHGFIGTLTSLVASGQLDLATGVRLARIYTILPSMYPSSPQKYLTTVLSARQFHSLSSPVYSKTGRRRTMQLILDQVHAFQKQLTGDEWAGTSMINSSKVLVLTGTQMAVLDIVDRLRQLDLANPVMDIEMPSVAQLVLCRAALIPSQWSVLHRLDVERRPPSAKNPRSMHVSTSLGRRHNTGSMHHRTPIALSNHLTLQLRWHKTLSGLYRPEPPLVHDFRTVGRGAKGLGVMLRGEIKRLGLGETVDIEEFGVGGRRS
ncbi:hypothetical protein P7C73_g3777, partial [Tremellales sp. Uapishka_1]